MMETAKIPSSPSYTRSTMASRMKESPRPKKQLIQPMTPKARKIAKVPPKTPSVYERSKERKAKGKKTEEEEIERKAIALHEKMMIKPADPNQPCGFAKLPTEIRQMIFDAVILPYSTIVTGSVSVRGTPGWRQLSSVCRRIRAEAAYTYYSQASFEFWVRHLDFSSIESWLRQMAPEHRSHLAVNRNPLRIVLDGFNWNRNFRQVNMIWRFCRPFGNVYTVPGQQHKFHCFTFAKWASWFLFCAQPPFAGIRWSYTVNERPWGPRIFREWEDYEKMERIRTMIENGLGVFNLPCVNKALKLTVGQKAKMKPRVLSMLQAVRDELQTIHPSKENQSFSKYQSYTKRLETLRVFLEKW